ncbi:ArnT family glycosyltransferase [Raineya sp.]|jgi:hypothetical protein
MNFVLNLRQNLLFYLCLCFCVLFAFADFDGYYFYDDTTYASYAYSVSQGNYSIHTSDIFAHRWGLIFPLALFYKIFGVNDFSNILLPLLATLASFTIFYVWIKKNLIPTQQAIALLLFFLDFYTLFFANKLYPDVLLSTLVLGAIFLLWERKNNFWQAFFFVFLNFWGFLCKETILFVVPFYVYVCVYDLLKKQNLGFWVMAFITALVLGVFYVGLYAYFTETPFFRFSLIQEGHQEYTQFRSESFLLERLTYAPLQMFVQTGLIIAFAGALTKLFALSKALQDFSSFTLAAFTFSLLSFWLMPVDFEHYTPIYLLPRHILFLVPLGAIVSAQAIMQNPYKVLTALLLFASALWVWKTLGIKVAGLYAVLAGWVGLPQPLTNSLTPNIPTKGKGILQYLQLFYKKEVSIAILGFLLIFHPVYTMLKPTETGYKYEKMLFEKHFGIFQKPCIVFTDDKLVSGHLWYFRFEKPQGVSFKNFDEMNMPNPSKLPKYVILNEYSIAYFELLGVKFPEWVKKIPENWQKIASFHKVHLYQIP